MKSFLITMLFVSIQIGFPMNPPHQEGRIVNGIPISADSYPWIVSLRSILIVNESSVQEASFCTASLINISPPVILTAAHCLHGFTYDSITNTIVDPYNFNNHYLYADINRTYANHNVSGDSFASLFINTSMFEIHPQYNDSNFEYNDIALIIFKDHNETIEPLPTISKLPMIAAALPLGEACCVEGDTLIAIGYGMNTSYTDATYTLEQTTLTYIDELACAQLEASLYLNTTDATIIAWYLEYIYYFEEDHSNICVIGQNTDICEGDSGGPLLRSNDNGNVLEIVGVTSFGGVICNSGEPSGYTSTAHFYDWIYETIDPYLSRTEEETTVQPITTIVSGQNESITTKWNDYRGIANSLFWVYAVFASTVFVVFV